jgi:large subunit ribosomal protein L29
MAKTVQNKATDVRTKTPDELNDLLLDLRKEQFNLRFQRAAGQNEGIGRVKQVRREIARVKTIMAEKSVSPATQS